MAVMQPVMDKGAPLFQKVSRFQSFLKKMSFANRISYNECFDWLALSCLLSDRHNCIVTACVRTCMCALVNADLYCSHLNITMYHILLWQKADQSFVLLHTHTSEWLTDRQTDKQMDFTDRQTDRQAGHTNRHTEMQVIHTVRKTDRQTYRQAVHRGRQTGLTGPAAVCSGNSWTESSRPPCGTWSCILVPQCE